MPDEHCADCGKAGIQRREVTRSFGRGPDLLVIEGIPLCSCPHCGAAYFSAQTMHAIERIKRQRQAVAVERLVPVASFEDPSPHRDAA